MIVADRGAEYGGSNMADAGEYVAPVRAGQRNMAHRGGSWRMPPQSYVATVAPAYKAGTATTARHTHRIDERKRMEISGALRELLFEEEIGTVELDRGVSMTYHFEGDYWTASENGTRITSSACGKTSFRHWTGSSTRGKDSLLTRHRIGRWLAADRRADSKGGIESEMENAAMRHM